ncbi:hypothetical protein F4680DRAFT_87281 [Xylaria scruposa]|nr:hypothetical protein F4680DRAFT_87281 [Xylaria scruposa]
MHTLVALPVALLNLLLLNSLPTVGAVSDRSICVRQNAAILAEAAACGDIRSLEKCFSDVPNFVTMGDLQRCFIDSGCTIAEASSEATIILKGCDESSSAPELRRRGPEAMPAATPNPTPQDKTTESTSPDKATTATLTRPSVCSTARMIKTTVCPITSLGKDDFSKLPCTSTTLTTLECAATNVCWDNGDCIFRDNNLQLSGLIVTIVLSLVVVGAVATLLYFYALDRKARRLAREKLEEEKRALVLKLDQEASEAKAREYAQYQMKRERLRRQHMEAQEWARRRAMEVDQRPANPFGDGAAAAADAA